jgi:hypothetical protein
VTLVATPDTKCKACGKHFLRSNSFRTVCSGSCVDFFAARVERESKKRAKADKKAEAEQTRARRVALKSRRDWLNEAQNAFNAWVRARDAALPCVSCGRHHQGQYHAGHYLTVGARPELRFTADNVHKQCSACNTHLHGNLILYRVELVKRIGLELPSKPSKARTLLRSFQWMNSRPSATATGY